MKYSFVQELFDRATANIRARQAGRSTKRGVGGGAIVGGLAGGLLGSKLGGAGMAVGGALGATVGSAIGGIGGAVKGGTNALLRTKKGVVDAELKNSNKIMRAGRFLGPSEHKRAVAQARAQQAMRANQNLANYRQAIAYSPTKSGRQAVARNFKKRSAHINAMYGADKQYT